VIASGAGRGLEKATLGLHIAGMSMDAVFRALGDPIRRELLDRLHARNGQTLNELCDGRDITRQAVTKHLLVLEAANLVATLKRGREKLHYLNAVPIHEIGERWIGKYQRSHLQALGDLKRNLEGKTDE
jgi:DNA-binding transcriptional ArsR family regulator